MFSLSTLCKTCQRHLHLKELSGNFHQRRSISQSVAALRQNKVPTHYEELGLKPSATPAEIRSAFLQLSKLHHPDVNPDDRNSHGKFVRLNEAYSVLNNDTSRRDYDNRLGHTAGQSQATSGPQRPYDGQSQNDRWGESVDWEAFMRDNRRRAAETAEFYRAESASRRERTVFDTVLGLCYMALIIATVVIYQSLLRKSEARQREQQRVLGGMANAGDGLWKSDK